MAEHIADEPESPTRRGMFILYSAVKLRFGISIECSSQYSKKSLETAAARLDELLFHPHPSYGVRENVNDIVSARRGRRARD